MTALAAARKTLRKQNAGDRYHDFVIAAGETLYPGAMVGIDANGLAMAGAADAVRIVGAYLGDIYSGASPIALAGETIRIYEGVFLWAEGVSITNANRGDIAYCEDDQTVKLTATTEPVAGIIVDTDAGGGAWVQMGLAFNSMLQLGIVDNT